MNKHIELDGIDEFLRFLNQETSTENQDILMKESEDRMFDEVWNCDRLHCHSSFTSSCQHFIVKHDDFYLILTLLYPLSNKTTLNIRFILKYTFHCHKFVITTFLL